MSYFNVSLFGLRGRLHPALKNIITPEEVRKSRIHIKMLTGDYLTFEVKSTQSGGSPYCLCCPGSSFETESLQHIVTACEAYTELRERILEEYSILCSTTMNKLNFQIIREDPEVLCQFILDPSSMNLSSRVNISDPKLDALFKISRDYCYSINSKRLKILKDCNQL